MNGTGDRGMVANRHKRSSGGMYTRMSAGFQGLSSFKYTYVGALYAREVAQTFSPLQSAQIMQNIMELNVAICNLRPCVSIEDSIRKSNDIVKARVQLK